VDGAFRRARLWDDDGNEAWQWREGAMSSTTGNDDRGNQSQGGDARVAAAMKWLEGGRGDSHNFRDCDYNPFADPQTNETWRVVRKDDGLEIVAGRDEGRVVARLDDGMAQQAERICILVNREQQAIPVEVIGYGEPGDLTFRDWYFGRARDGRPHFRSLDHARLVVALLEGDEIVVCLSTEVGCSGPGVRTRWDEPAWYVIQAAVELAARHVGEQVAHAESTLDRSSVSRPQSAVRHH
jgi:hypothetical protein